MSEIQSLTARIRDLSQSVDWWNSAMISGLALAALAAIFVLVATRIVVRRSGQLSEAQQLLSAARDRQLQADLKGKDIEIGNLKLELEGQRQDTLRFQQAADEARLALDKQVRLQGPRSRFLQESRSVLVERLKAFSGQSVILTICGGANVVDGEKTGTMNTLLDILGTGTGNAGWRANLQYDDRCIGGPSLAVFFHANAGENTRKAAESLAEQLNQVVPFTPVKALPFDPQKASATAMRERGLEGEKSIARTVRDNPESVVILLGPHP